MPPNESYIKELVEDRKQFYGAFRKEVEANRKARALEDFTSDDVPEAYRVTTQVVNLPRIPDTLQRMVAICTDDDPVISVPPADDTATAKRNTSLRERWMSGAMERMANDSGRDAWRMAMDAALSDGLGVLKLTHDKAAWDDEPQREKGEDGEYSEDADEYLGRLKSYRKGAPFPFFLTDVDCLTYLPVHTNRRLSEVCEVTQRLIVPTAKALGVKPVSRRGGKAEWKKLKLGEKFPLDALPAGVNSTVECIEHWDPPYLTYLFDGIQVDQRKIEYKHPPYYAFGGYTTSSRDPEKANRAVVASMRPLVKAMNRYLSILSNWAMYVGFPFIEEPEGGVPGLVPGQDTAQSIRPGSVLARGTRFVEAPTGGADLKELVKIMMAESDRSGLSAVMYGYQGGTTSGYQVASLQAAAQSVLKPVLRNAATALEQMLFDLQWMVENVIRTTVYVWGRGGSNEKKAWLGLGPDDVKGYYYVNVELKPLLPLDEIAQRSSALQMVQGGLWPREYALQKTGEEQAEILLDKIAVEKYLERPEINDRISYDAAVAAGIIKPEPAKPTIFGPDGGMLSGGPEMGGGPPMGPGGLPPMPQGPQQPPVPGRPPLPNPNMGTVMANGPQPGGAPEGM